MLTSLKIKSLVKPGKHGDRDGLYLNVTKRGNKSWIYRYQLDGKRHEMGLGSLKDVTLAEARDRAFDARRLYKRGIDPKGHRDTENARSLNRSFKDCAEAYIDSHKSGWKNEKHVDQWTNTLTQYAYPVFGALPVDKIDTAKIMEVLQPMWNIKTETASRVRGRIENILSWAIVQGFREGPNPALWRGHLSMLLPKRSKVQKVTHHAALPYAEIPHFIGELRKRQSISARALEFTILTCARTSEVIGARWEELDVENAIWAIPPARMKAGLEHRVPLSNEAISLLEQLPRESNWLFMGRRQGKPISNITMLKLLKKDLGYSDFTVHGFRSTFRDWAAEVSNFPREVAESALAHVLTNQVEAAYQRGDLLEKRRDMMQAWSDYLSSNELVTEP